MKVTTFSAAEVSVRPQYTPSSYLGRDEPVRMSRVQPWIGLYKSAVTVLLLTCKRPYIVETMRILKSSAEIKSGSIADGETSS